jgi:hypothetical protein
MSNHIESAYKTLAGLEHKGIWLEVSEVLLQNQLVFVRLIGDRASREPEWWLVKSAFENYQSAREAELAKANLTGEELTAAEKAAAELNEKANKNAADTAGKIYDALDKKRLVLVKLASAEEGGYLCCTELRIQSGNPNVR